MFSIIIPYYEEWVRLSELKRCLDSLREQTCQDFEVLLYHDGPMKKDIPKYLFKDLDLSFEITIKRYADWGHSLRDKGILKAKGEYIIHLNADNLLFSDCLEVLKTCIDNTNKQPMYVMKLNMFKDMFYQRTLIPYPKKEFIDCMQLIMKRDMWIKIGGWYDKSMNSDGTIYEEVMNKNVYVFIPKIMGEHH